MSNILRITTKYFFIIVVILCSSHLTSAYSINPEDYLEEFNNLDEICTTKDVFFYTDSNNKLSFVVIYDCCQNDKCIQIPFDIQNQKELSLLDLQESFDISYARDNIRNGNLTPSNYFPESFDVCAYFSDKLPEESRNLAVKTADSVKEFAPKNYRKIYKTLRGVGFATGFISEFEIGVFIVSVGCNKLSKQENEAFFKVAECYNNIQSIESGAVHYGITSQTYNCMQEADILLEQVLESWGQKIKGAFNKVANTAKAVWNYGNNLAQGNISTNLDITETSFEAAERIKDKLNLEKDYLENPISFILVDYAQKRLDEKRYLTQTEYNNLKEKYNSLNNQIPGRFWQFVKNIIYNPNTNYDKSRLYLKEGGINLDVMKELIEVSKYNSAIGLNDLINLNINNSLNSYEPLSKVKRNIDIFAVLFWLIVFGIIIFLCIKFLKQSKIFQIN
ncbi:hypothetical protein GOV12_04490 [Candidatus Pacearchaeota archaeon]|nr:hypothetical protein [Candidatus Pacearchaeota archaeon]